MARKFLFICTGNVCRSLMAEKLLEKLAQARGLDWESRSCGTAAERYFQVPAAARAALAREGIFGFEHTPRLVDRELLLWADLALTMTADHERVVLDLFPEFRAKVRVLRAFAGLTQPDISDPIGLEEQAYADCASRIREALERLLPALPGPA